MLGRVDAALGSHDSQLLVYQGMAEQWENDRQGNSSSAGSNGELIVCCNSTQLRRLLLNTFLGILLLNYHRESVLASGCHSWFHLPCRPD